MIQQEDSRSPQPRQLQKTAAQLIASAVHKAPPVPATALPNLNRGIRRVKIGYRGRGSKSLFVDIDSSSLEGIRGVLSVQEKGSV